MFFTVTYDEEENSRTYSESHTLWFCPGLGSERALWRVTVWCNSSLPLECTDWQTCLPKPCWADSESLKKKKERGKAVFNTLKNSWTEQILAATPTPTLLNVKRQKSLILQKMMTWHRQVFTKVLTFKLNPATFNYWKWAAFSTKLKYFNDGKDWISNRRKHAQNKYWCGLWQMNRQWMQQMRGQNTAFLHFLYKVEEFQNIPQRDVTVRC